MPYLGCRGWGLLGLLVEEPSLISKEVMKLMKIITQTVLFCRLLIMEYMNSGIDLFDMHMKNVIWQLCYTLVYYSTVDKNSSFISREVRILMKIINKQTYAVDFSVL